MRKLRTKRSSPIGDIKIIVILFMTLLLVSRCKKDSSPAPSSPPPMHSSSSSATLIGSWCMDSIYYKGTMYKATVADGTTDTIVFSSSTMYESDGKSTEIYSTRNDTLMLVLASSDRNWMYSLTSSNLVLKCDTESQYLHKF